MNVIDLTIVRVGLGLVLLIVANIGLGSTGAIIDGTWDRVKFRNGCIKGAIVALALVAVWFAGYLNPDLFVVEADGQQVNLMTAVYVALLAAITAYAVDVVKKLKDMLTTVTPGAKDMETEKTDDTETEGGGEHEQQQPGDVHPDQPEQNEPAQE